jgi:hypothetical protein
MTKEEWLKCADPTPMLEFLRGKVSNRKLRLFAVACCRHVWEWLPQYSRKAVEVAERYADKQASRAELFQAGEDIAKDEIAQGYSDCATGCAWYATAWGLWEAVTGVVRTAAITPRTPEWLKVVNARRKTQAMHDAAGRASEQRILVQHKAYCQFLRDLWPPFKRVTFNPAWRTNTARSLARAMYESRDFSAMPILADALQDAGCDNTDILTHCRDSNATHVRGCWVVDFVLGKA